MDKKEQQERFDSKVEAFKQDWFKEKGENPTEKVCWYFRKGMEKQCDEVNSGRMAIVGERFFDTKEVLLLDDPHYPGRLEFEDCKAAFMKGYQTEL